MLPNVQSQERPPFVEFVYQPIEDRALSIKNGRYTTVDVAFARINRPGSKDTHVEEAEAWLKKLDERARQQLCPGDWAVGFRRKYEDWKNGTEVPVTGTPVKGWPVLGPSAQNMVIAAGFRTVEDLAAAPDAEIQNVGMGAVDIRQKARNWLDEANSHGKVVERLSALEIARASDKATILALQTEIARLKGLLGSKADA